MRSPIAMAVLATVTVGPVATENAFGDKPAEEDPAELCQYSLA